MNFCRTFVESLSTYTCFGAEKGFLDFICHRKQLKNKMTPTVVYRIKRFMGILLIVFGVGLMLKGFLPKNNKINTLLEQVDKK